MIDLQGYPSALFAGAFLCNALPHLVAGVQGHAFPTPFARPPGVGNSPPLTNFIWGFGNVVVGGLLLSNYPIIAGLNAHFATMLLGALAIGIFLAVHFGKVHRDRS